MMEELKEALKLCDRYNDGQYLTMEEVKTIAYNNLIDGDSDTWYYIKKTFDLIMSDNNAQEWEDFDESYPGNPYHVGYKLEDEIFITGYTGVAGRYWQTNDHYSIYKC